MNNKVLSKKDLEKLIKDSDPSMKFVQKKKTSKSSEYWDFFILFWFTVINSNLFHVMVVKDCFCIHH